MDKRHWSILRYRQHAVLSDTALIHELHRGCNVWKLSEIWHDWIIHMYFNPVWGNILCLLEFKWEVALQVLFVYGFTWKLGRNEFHPINKKHDVTPTYFSDVYYIRTYFFTDKMFRLRGVFKVICFVKTALFCKTAKAKIHY